MTEGPQVAIVMGSKSDLNVMVEAATTLREFNVRHELRVLSAHRTPVEKADREVQETAHI
jgi:phosphoribosylcarboxyaminoimidazole (NCAIR) mutase